MTQAAEIPVAAVVAKLGMAAKNANTHRYIAPVGIFHVYMENTVGKFVDKPYIIHVLITQVAGVVVEPKCRVVVQRFQREMG